MLIMTLDEAIKHCLDVAEQNETSAITYKNCKEIKANMYEKLTAEKAESDCRECAADHRQLAERQNSIEHSAYIHGKGGGYMTFGKQNIDFLTGWLGNPEGEDYEP